VGRIRSIKPEILEDDVTANLSHLEWRLFVSVWLLADDYGNLRGEPSYIRGAALWAARHDRDDVANALMTLVREGLLVCYRVRGQIYLHIRGWSKHQKVDKAGKPRMPGPKDPQAEVLRGLGDGSREPRGMLAESSRESRESLAPDLDLDLDPEHDREKENPPPRAIPPTTEPSTDVGAERERSARQEARREIWAELERTRASVAADLGATIRPLAAQDPGETELAMRLLEAGDIARGKADARHVIAVGAAEARADPDRMQWFSGALFTAANWRRALGVDPAHVRPRAGPDRSASRAHQPAEERRRIPDLTKPTTKTA
jgi:hypothetical protein